MTNFIIGPNSSGKTRKLLEFAKANNYLVICRDRGSMERKAQAYGLYGISFMDYLTAAQSIALGDNDFFANDQDLFNADGFVVDEIDKFMKVLISTPMMGFTQTQEEN